MEENSPAAAAQSDLEDLDSSDSEGENPISNSSPNESVKMSEPNQPKLESYHPKVYGQKKRDFQYDWFKKYPWLHYDEKEKEARCFCCETYQDDAHFVFNNWKKPEKLLTHSKSNPHSFAMLKWMSAKHSKANKTSIVTMLQSEHARVVEDNRKYLKVIIETLMFTAVQNIAIRGAIESRKDLGEISDTNRGNFLELLSFRARDNIWLEKKLESSLKERSSWTSPSIQNEILSILAAFTMKRIISDVKASKFFALIADETSDSGCR